MRTEHQQLRELLGAYVLGQLDATAHREVSGHLAGCADCRAEVASLEPVANAVRSLDPTVTEHLRAPDELGERVIRRIHEQERAATRRVRVRRGVAGVLVAASLAGAFALGSWSVGSQAPPVVAIQLAAAPGIKADAGLVKHTWGTELKLEATGLTQGASYRVTFRGEDGARVDGGTFIGTGSSAVRCSLNAAIGIDEATQVSITDRSGTEVLSADL